VFTDGSSRPNPGPGGWAAVAVLNGRVLWRAAGGDDSPDCTNNKMEITALLEALRRLPAGSEIIGAAPTTAAAAARVVLYSDSDLCVKTLTTWAAGWERNGWLKGDKKAPANLALVQEAFALFQARPAARVQWVRAHDGSCWNEYVDVLADAARKSAAAHSPMHSP
jgi:ribonuclease HI